MDKINMIKNMLPLIPIQYRRTILMYIHIEEIMNIMTSLQQCLNGNFMYSNENLSKDPKDMLNILKQNMPKQDSDMINMIMGMQNMGNMSSMFDSFNMMGMGSSDKSSGSEVDNEEIDDLFKDFLSSTDSDNE